MKTLSNTTPKARKEHQCNFCSGKIGVGETYKHQVNVYEGDIYQWKTHTRCSEITSKLKMYEDADEGVCDQMFSEYINHEYGELKDREVVVGIFEKTTFQERLDFVCNYHLS